MADSQTEWTPGQLMQMDESEARSTLTVDEFDRWEKLTELNEDAEETKFEWQEQSKQVQEVTVNADMEQLGTSLDLFGNSVLVHIDPSDRQFRQAMSGLEDYQDDFDHESEVVELDEETQEEIANRLQAMLDAVLVKWNGTRWSNIPDGKRAAVLAQCRDKWGVDGLMLGWINIGQAVNEEREDIEETIKSFRSA